MTLEELIAAHDQTQTAGGAIDGCVCGWMYGYWDAPEKFSPDHTVAKWAAHVAAEIRKVFVAYPTRTCGGCDDKGAHAKWCRQRPGFDYRRDVLAPQVDQLADMIGSNNCSAANLLYRAAGVLRCAAIDEATS